MHSKTFKSLNDFEWLMQFCSFTDVFDVYRAKKVRRLDKWLFVVILQLLVLVISICIKIYLYRGKCF